MKDWLKGGLIGGIISFIFLSLSLLIDANRIKGFLGNLNDKFLEFFIQPIMLGGILDKIIPDVGFGWLVILFAFIMTLTFYFILGIIISLIIKKFGVKKFFLAILTGIIFIILWYLLRSIFGGFDFKTYLYLFTELKKSLIPFFIGFVLYFLTTWIIIKRKQKKQQIKQ